MSITAKAKKLFHKTERLLKAHPVLTIVGVVGLAAVLAVTRRPDLFFNAQFWAEEGGVWFKGAYDNGLLPTLFHPYPEYFVVLQRLLAWVAVSVVPFAHVPLAFNVMGLAIQLLPIIFLLSSRFSRIVRSRILAILLALALIAVPNSGEVFSNFANMQWHLGLVALFIFMADYSPRRAWKIFDAVILFAVGLSCPLIFFFAPIAAWRWWRDRKNYSLLLLGIIIATSILQIISILFISPTHRNGHAFGTFELFVKMITGQIFIGGLSGPDYVATLYNHMYRLYAFFFGGMCLIAYAFIRGPIWLKYAITFGVLSIAAMLVSVQDVSGLSVWQGLTNPTGGQRYWYIPIVVWLMVLIWAAFKAKFKLVQGIAIALLIIFLYVGVYQGWQMKPQPDTHFRATASKFNSLPKGQWITFPINPPGWTVTVQKK